MPKVLRVPREFKVSNFLNRHFIPIPFFTLGTPNFSSL